MSQSYARLILSLSAAAGLAINIAIPTGFAAPQPSAPSRQPPDAAEERTSARAIPNGIGPPVTLVLANATADDALRMLTRVSGIKVELLPQTRSADLPLLSVVAQREPFFMLLQQIAMAEGLAVVPSQGGFRLFAVGSSYQAPMGRGGGSLGGAGRGSETLPHPNGPLSAAPAGGFAAALPDVFPGPTSGPVRPRGAVTSRVMGSDAEDGTGGPRTDELLQSVLSYANNGAPVNPPDQSYPSLRTPAGSLEYVGVVTEALTRLNGSLIASAGAETNARPTVSARGAAADPVERLRVLLGRAEEIHRRACLKEQLQMEVILLTQRLPQASPSMQPLLRSVLDHRQRQLAELEVE